MEKETNQLVLSHSLSHQRSHHAFVNRAIETGSKHPTSNSQHGYYVFFTPAVSQLTFTQKVTARRNQIVVVLPTSPTSWLWSAPRSRGRHERSTIQSLGFVGQDFGELSRVAVLENFSFLRSNPLNITRPNPFIAFVIFCKKILRLSSVSEWEQVPGLEKKRIVEKT
jgi:hypothetical protein